MNNLFFQIEFENGKKYEFLKKKDFRSILKYKLKEEDMGNIKKILNYLPKKNISIYLGYKVLEHHLYPGYIESNINEDYKKISILGVMNSQNLDKIANEFNYLEKIKLGGKEFLIEKLIKDSYSKKGEEYKKFLITPIMETVSKSIFNENKINLFLTSRKNFKNK